MEFVSIPPQINQQVRLNATFVVRFNPAKDEHRPLPKRQVSNTVPFWCPTGDWENPIWGWVLLNYATQSIQFFLQDGTFYHEVNLASGNGAQNSPTLIPFASHDEELVTPEHTQLKRLVERLGNEDFQRAFYDMLIRANENMKQAPIDSSIFSNALIGRPLALTHVGWSLELATPPVRTQTVGDISSTNPVDDYEIKIKLGDATPGVDGLVGVFNCAQNLVSGQSDDLGLSLERLFSDFDHERETDRSNGGDGGDGTPHAALSPLILPIEQISLKAFYISPENGRDGHIDQEPDTHNDSRNAELQVRGLLVDPSMPLHTFSPISPVRKLSLPEWVWQDALANIKSFFRMGPLVTTEGTPWAPENDRELQSRAKSKSSQQLTDLPTFASDNWVWLQPSCPEVGTADPGACEEDDDDDDGGVKL